MAKSNKKFKIDLEEFVELVKEFMREDSLIETEVSYDGVQCGIPDELIDYMIKETGERPRSMGIS